MANKVISIKLDEKDIERLKKYHEVLKNLGIISDKTLSMNGLYKHLLLDYIEEDVRRMISSCASFGLLPKYWSPEEFENKNIIFSNTYGLDQENFSKYIECVKESMSKSIEKMDKNIDLLNDIAGEEVVFFEKGDCSIIPLPKEEIQMYYENQNEFWISKAMSEKMCFDDDIQKNSFTYDYKMINESSLSMEAKKKLMDAIEEYEKGKLANLQMIAGRGTQEIQKK